LFSFTDMSEQFAARIKNFFKDNVVGFVFLLIIAFFGFSVWMNTQSTNQQVNELIDFADQSLPQIRTQFQSISQRSRFDSHTSQQYDQVVQDFETLDSLLQSLSQTIPTENNDIASDALENELRAFFWETRVDIVSRWIEMLKARQNLVDQYNVAADLKAAVKSRSTAQLQAVVTASRTVIDFERENLNLIEDIEERQARDEELDKDLDRMGTIQGILNRTPEDGEISPADQAEISNLYAESGWPLEISIFPGIDVDNLETSEFASQVATLRGLVIDLRTKYPETIDE